MAGNLHCISRAEKTTVVLTLLHNVASKICPLVVDQHGELVTVDRQYIAEVMLPT